MNHTAAEPRELSLNDRLRASIAKESTQPGEPEAPAPGGQFVAVDRSIMRGAEHIATAITHSFAKRIARALNLHVPNRKGY